jgi:hypothetical protein
MFKKIFKILCPPEADEVTTIYLYGYLWKKVTILFYIRQH